MFVCVPLRMMLFGAMIFWIVIVACVSRELDERGDEKGSQRAARYAGILALLGTVWLTAEWVVYLQ